MSIYNDITLIENAIYDVLYGEQEYEQEAIDNLVLAKEETIKNGLEKLCKVRVNINAEIDGLQAEIKRLQDQLAAKKAALARLENYIFSVYQRSGEQKVEAGTFVVSKRTSQSVYVQDGATLPEIYIRKKVVEEPDKIMIKDDLKKGIEIPGCQLVTSEHLSIK